MATISYDDLNLTINTGTQKIEGTEIEVLSYLPITDKYDLINMTLQSSKVGGEPQSVLLDMFFHLYLVYMYTNIEFSEEEKQEPFKIYDILKSNGIIDKVLMTIDGDEYNILYTYLIEQLERDQEYDLNVSGMISKIINELPAQMQEVAKIVENFNPEKVNNVLEFAKSVNNGQLPGQK